MSDKIIAFQPRAPRRALAGPAPIKQIDAVVSRLRAATIAGDADGMLREVERIKAIARQVEIEGPREPEPRGCA